MAVCANCGFNEKDSNAKFCKICGRPLTGKVIVHSSDELIDLVNVYSAHANAAHLDVLDLNFIDTSELTSIKAVFLFNEYMGKVDVSGWDVSNVEDMALAFNGSQFDADLSNWDVSKVKNMSLMFCQAAGRITGLGKWNVSNVTDMSHMFSGTKNSFLDIETWDVSNVKTMTGMFESSEFEGDIGAWNVSNVKDMRFLFKKSKFNGDISKWDVSSVENMSEMFLESKFTGDISNWNVSNVIDMSLMFKGNFKFRGDLRKWRLDSLVKIDDFGFIGKPGKNLHIDIEGWKEQLQSRTIIDIGNTEELKKLKDIVLVKDMDKLKSN